MLNSAALETILLPCVLKRQFDEKTFTCQAELKVWVSTLYNFETKQDYYHVLLEETYPGDKFKFGQYYSQKVNKWGQRQTAAGYTYGGLYVKPAAGERRSDTEDRNYRRMEPEQPIRIQ